MAGTGALRHDFSWWATTFTGGRVYALWATTFTRQQAPVSRWPLVQGTRVWCVWVWLCCVSSHRVSHSVQLWIEEVGDLGGVAVVGSPPSCCSGCRCCFCGCWLGSCFVVHAICTTAVLVICLSLPSARSTALTCVRSDGMHSA